jgi:hypothetical protein
MTTLTPPPERELPAELRARVLDEIGPAPRRHWVPVAAAVAAAVALAVPVAVLAGRDGPAPTAPGGPAATSAAPRPAAAEIVRRCLADDLIGEYGDERLQVVFADDRGFVAAVGGRHLSTTCGFSPTWARVTNDGAEESSSGGLEVGYLPEGRRHLTITSQSAGPDDRQPGGSQAVVTGRVDRDVRRVVVRWDDGQAVTAALDGPYFAVRAFFPPGPTPGVSSPRGVAVAYDAQGRELGHTELTP